MVVRDSKGDRAAFGIVIILLHAAMIAIFAGTAWYSQETDGGELYQLMQGATNSSNPAAYLATHSVYGPGCADIADVEMCTDEFTTDFDSLFQDVHIMVFIGFGFLMTFLKKYAFSAVSINLLVAAFACEWSALLYSYFNQFSTNANNRGQMDLETMINADFTAATVLISMGAVLGATTPLQLLIMTLIECVLAQVNLYIGYVLFQANDPGGSMAIHTFGAYFGLSVSTVLTLRRKVPHSELEESSYTNDVFSMIGTVFLWICWPSFNGAMTHGNSRGRAILNTYLSLIGSTMVVFALSTFFNLDEKNPKKRGRIEMVHVQNATLAGGVAMGTACNAMVSPWASLLVGSLAGLISVVGYKYMMPALRKVGIHDTCGVNNLHGMPGFFGGLVGVLFGGIATLQQYGYSLYATFPAMAPMANTTQYATLSSIEPTILPGSGRSNNIQAGYQMAALAVTMGIAIVGGWVTGAILRIPRIWGEITKPEEFYADDVNFTVPEDYYTHESLAKGETVFVNMASTVGRTNGEKLQVDNGASNGNGADMSKF